MSDPRPIARFMTPRMVATVGVVEAFDGATIAELIVRHLRGDWGELVAEDQAANESALRQGYGIVLSAFRVGGKRVWVHSYIGGEEAYTTVLLPEEY